MDVKLAISTNLRVIDNGSDAVLVYNSRLGNLKKISRSALNLLRLFSSPKSPESVLGARAVAILPVLENFKNCYFLVEDESAEFDVIQDQIENRRHALKAGAHIGGLQLSISNACNFQCKMCFVDRSDVQSLERKALIGKHNINMDLATAVKAIEKIVPVMKKHSKDTLVVKFFGREPMINWPMINKLLEYCGQHDFGLKVKFDMTTNASLITQEIAAQLAKHHVHVSVSVDGLPRANDKIRVTKNHGDDTFWQIKRGIELMRDAGVDLDFNSVISSINFDDYDYRFIDYARENGVDAIAIIVSFMDDYLRPQRVKTPGEIADKIFDLYRYGDEVGVLVHGYWYNPVARLWKSQKTRNGIGDILHHHDTCTATGFQLNVEPTGDVFSCKATSKKLGNIDDVGGLLGSDAYEWTIMRTYNNVPACSGCEIEGFCQGVCIGHIEQKFNNDIYQVDQEYCDVYRGITKRILSYALDKNLGAATPVRSLALSMTGGMRSSEDHFQPAAPERRKVFPIASV